MEVSRQAASPAPKRNKPKSDYMEAFREKGRKKREASEGVAAKRRGRPEGEAAAAGEVASTSTSTSTQAPPTRPPPPPPTQRRQNTSTLTTEEIMLQAVLDLSMGVIPVAERRDRAPEVVSGVEMTYESLVALEDVQVPLAEELLYLVPTGSADADDAVSVCAVCTEQYEVGEELQVLPCSHSFHKDCISPWLGRHSKYCPVCKAEVTREALLGSIL